MPNQAALEDRARAAQERELETARLRAQQQKAADRQSAIDELRAKRCAILTHSVLKILGTLRAQQQKAADRQSAIDELCARWCAILIHSVLKTLGTLRAAAEGRQPPVRHR